MHRRPLLEMLRRYQQQFPEDSETVGRICELVENHADCFERNCMPGHITGSAWVVSRDRQRALLVHHRKLNRWLQPGGHADGHAAVEETALREAIEESGIRDLRLAGCSSKMIPLDVDIHNIPARFDKAGRVVEPAHEHHDIRFLVVAPTDAEPQVSSESNAVRWCTPSAVRELTCEESVLRLMRKSAEC